MKAFSRFLMIVFFLGGICFALYAQSQLIKGTVDEVSEDGSYIVVDGRRVELSYSVQREASFDVGDKVELNVDFSGSTLEATDYDYIFEDYTYDSENLDYEKDLSFDDKEEDDDSSGDIDYDSDYDYQDEINVTY